MVKVLIVDDSALVRQVLCELLEGAPGIEVLAAVADPLLAAARMRQEAPDVILLDLEMPRMDGLSFLRRLMAQHPLPVIICASGCADGSSKALQALEAGAVEVIDKPSVGTREFLAASRARLREAVLAAASAGAPRPARSIEPKLSADVILPAPSARPVAGPPLLVVGASTGGCEALRVFLSGLPASAPPTVVVQHMPGQFTRGFAERLDGLCQVSVREASDGEVLASGSALIAPGGPRHLALQRHGASYRVSLIEGPAVSRHRPSVDVLFRSAARSAGQGAVGVLMTGMGDDGAHGLLELRQAGAYTLAQDEASCVVFGMPAEAIRRGAACRVLSLGALAAGAMSAFSRR